MTAASELTEAFADAVVQILRASPQAIYLLVGDGDVSAVKRRFESAGVSKRVGYTSKRRDFAAFVKLADVYLASPDANATDVLHAMNAEKPVFAAAGSRAAEIVGGEGTTQINLLADRAGKVIGDANARGQLGRAMRERVRQKFTAEQFVRQIERAIEASAKLIETTPSAIAAWTDFEATSTSHDREGVVLRRAEAPRGGFRPPDSVTVAARRHRGWNDRAVGSRRWLRPP